VWHVARVLSLDSVTDPDEVVRLDKRVRQVSRAIRPVSVAAVGPTLRTRVPRSSGIVTTDAIQLTRSGSPVGESAGL
jgi:hypothetical protein